MSGFITPKKTLYGHVQRTPSAQNIKYDNSKSRLDSTSVQGAIDEVATHDYRIVKLNGNPVQEWFCPPMELFQEYRLAERFMGKVVYTKLVKFDFDYQGNPNEQYNIAIDKIDKLVEYGGFTSVDNPTDEHPREVHCAPCRDVELSCHYREEENDIELNLHVENQSSSYAGFYADTCYVWIKYTKTTD
jgi:hypothetical protein